MSSTLQVKHRRIARLLEDPKRRRFLLSLATEERSLSEAAELNRIRLNLAHYHLRQLIGAGLVEVTREQKRAGRPIRFYRAKYSAYVVPSSLLRARPHDRAARALSLAIDHARDLAGGGVLFDVDESGRPRMREVAGDGPVPLELWRRLKLSGTEAVQLFDELKSVIHRYEASPRRRDAEWTIHIAAAETDA